MIGENILNLEQMINTTINSIVYRSRLSDCTPLTRTSRIALTVNTNCVIVISLTRWFTGALYLSLAILLALAIFEEPEVSFGKNLFLKFF